MRAIWLSIALALCGGVLPLSAQAVITEYDLNIPRQSLDAALKEFAQQTGLQIARFSDTINGSTMVGPITGALSAEDALNSLLIPHGLSYRVVNDRTIAVVNPTELPTTSTTSSLFYALGEGAARSTADEAQATSEGPNERKGLWNRHRLAQANEQSASREEGRGEDQQGVRRAIGDTVDTDLGEIIVTGTNIRGVYPSSSPVEIYTAEDIARTGATTTEQFIAKLPQNLGTRTQYAANSLSSVAGANSEAVNGVDLRGLGVGTTLVLLNGRRVALSSSGQAVDISLIPVSALERVEVLTDGASAIYGSDAIGGVVNFVLRDDFEGAETRVSYGGVTSGGLRQGNFTQTFGRRWDGGRALASYDFYSASALETRDRPYASLGGPGTLTPEDVRNNALIAISQGIGSALTLNGDFAFSHREVRNVYSDIVNPNPLFHLIARSQSNTEQYFANIGLDARINESLNGQVLVTYSNVDVDSRSVANLPGLGLVIPLVRDTNHSALDLTTMLGGELFALPAGVVRFSLGGGYMDERYVGLTASGQRSVGELGRTTTYAFAELFAPLVNEEQNIPLVHRLELSLAARYTRYDDTSEPRLDREFGDRTNPKIGLLWGISPSLSVRGTYGASFRAPFLTELDPGASTNSLELLSVGGVASTVLSVRGPSPELDPETAESYTVGFDYRPRARSGFHLSATYFNIDYSDRVAVGDPSNGTGAMANPSLFPDVIFQPASAEQIEAFLQSTRNVLNRTTIDLSDPSAAAAMLAGMSNVWLFDGRTRNLASSRLDGIDVSAGQQFTTPWGIVSLGGQLTHLFAYEQQITESAPVVSVINTVLLPSDLRGRIYVGLATDPLDATIGVNYVDGYENPYAIGGVQSVESWTTIDANVSYTFSPDDGVFSGVRLGLSVQNLFDEAPPSVARGTGGTAVLREVGFDPANANPLGRLVVFGVSKSW